MRFKATIVGSIAKGFRDFDRELASASTGAVREAGVGLKSELRAQVLGAGMTPRLANTWRSVVYPERGISKDAATVVYSKAPHIIFAYDHGTVIRARGGRYLAIPLPAIQRFVRVEGKRQKITPRLFTQATGIKLVFLKGHGKNPVLAAIGARRSKTGRVSALRSRKATKTLGERTLLPEGYGAIPMFVLVPQVNVRRKLDVMRAFDHWAGLLGGLINQRIGGES